MFPPVPRLGSLRVALAIGCGAALTRADAAEVPTDPRTAAKQTFDQKVVPFLTTYCAGCHEKKQKGGVTFMYAKRDPGSPAFRSIWKTALSNLESEAMPPEDERQPTPEERAMFAAWVTGLKFMSPKDPGAFVIRRLNKTEYGNTLRDLFGADPALANSLPDEGSGAGYLNSLSPVLMEQYLGIANEVLDAVLAPEGRPPTAIQSSLQAPGQSLRRIATSLARRAYRRPPSEREIDVLLQVHALAKNQGRSDPEALRLLLKAVLVSPQFLFITPAPHTGTDPLPEIVPLDDHQLASRLSYFLWATMPDDELSALADAGKLRDPEALRAQVRRMLADPRSRALFDGFGAQWLGVDKLATKTFDAGKYPEMTPALREAMYDEARLFFADIVRENRGLTTFIEADFSYLNQTVAAVYGLDQSVTGSAMRKVRFTDPNRGGILGMPGILATTSFPNRTSPVNRGVWVLEQVLGQHVPPAPANVPSLEKQDRKKIAGLTLRQRTELHRTDPVCANCHKILDPIGFGLENFDAIGRWREADEAGGTIDPTGELPGNQRFTTPHELKRILARRSDDLCRNLTEKMLAHALCRPLEGYDEVVVDDLTKVIKADGYRMQTLISAIVTSYPFTHRRTKE